MNRVRNNSPWQWRRHMQKQRRYWLPERPRSYERAKELLLEVAAPLPVQGAIYLFHFGGAYQEWIVTKVTDKQVHFCVEGGILANHRMPISEWVSKIKTIKRMYEPVAGQRFGERTGAEIWSLTGTKTSRITSSGLSSQSLARPTNT